MFIKYIHILLKNLTKITENIYLILTIDKVANKSLRKDINIKCEQRKSVLKALKAS